jgi:hypothetical protein
MPKLSLDVEDLKVTSFGTESRTADVAQGAAMTLGDHTCRTCLLSYCDQTSCC